MDVYPDAKVLLSVRDADSWVKSMENTITQIFFGDTLMHHLARAQYNIDPNYAAWIDLLTEMNFGDERGAWRGTNGEPGPMAEAYERWNQEVKDTVPADRLLVWDPKEGWEPLCEFLEVDVPEHAAPARQRHGELPEEPDHGSRDRRRSTRGGSRTAPPEDPATQRPAAGVGVGGGSTSAVP